MGQNGAKSAEIITSDTGSLATKKSAPTYKNELSACTSTRKHLVNASNSGLTQKNKTQENFIEATGKKLKRHHKFGRDIDLLR